MGVSWNKKQGGDFEKTLIKEGTYPAKLKDYAEYTKQNPKSGETVTKLRWVFEVTRKNGQVVEIPGFTSMNWGSAEMPGTCRKWLAAYQGKSVKDEALDDNIDHFVGKSCEVVVATIGEGDNRSSIIDRIVTAGDEEEDETIPF